MLFQTFSGVQTATDSPKVVEVAAIRGLLRDESPSWGQRTAKDSGLRVGDKYSYLLIRSPELPGNFLELGSLSACWVLPT